MFGVRRPEPPHFILGPGKLSLWCWDSNSVDNSGEITATVDLVSA